MSSLYRKRGPKFIAANIFDVSKMSQDVFSRYGWDASESEVGGRTQTLLVARFGVLERQGRNCILRTLEREWSDMERRDDQMVEWHEDTNSLPSTLKSQSYLKILKKGNAFQVNAPDNQGQSLLCARSSWRKQTLLQKTRVKVHYFGLDETWLCREISEGQNANAKPMVSLLKLLYSIVWSAPHDRNPWSDRCQISRISVALLEEEVELKATFGSSGALVRMLVTRLS